MTSPLVLGHRGASVKAPENTLAALRLAMMEGADGFEFDVRVLGDGTPVILHDATVDRTTNGVGPLASFDRETIRGLDAGRGEAVPLLEDVLSEFLERAFLAIEMKEVLPEAVLDDLAVQFRGSLAARGIVASFYSKSVERARDRLPAVPRALILPLDRELPPSALVTYLGLRGIFARHESIDERYVVDCRRLGLALYAYPVNDPRRALELARLGVEGLISDDPGALRKALPHA
jgi:glycerophosphoryl diester phosphodiesterase